MLDLQKVLLGLVAQFMDMRMAHNLSRVNKRLYGYRLTYSTVVPIPQPLGEFRVYVGGLGRILADRQSEALHPTSSLGRGMAEGFRFESGGVGPRHHQTVVQGTTAYQIQRLTGSTAGIRAVAPFEDVNVSWATIQQLMRGNKELQHLDLSGATWLSTSTMDKSFPLCDMLAKWHRSLRWLSLRDIHNEYVFRNQLPILAEYASQLTHLRHLDLSQREVENMHIYKAVFFARLLMRVPNLTSFVLDVDSRLNYAYTAEPSEIIFVRDSLLKYVRAVRARKAELESQSEDKEEEEKEKDSGSTLAVMPVSAPASETDRNDVALWDGLQELDPQVAERLRRWVVEHAAVEGVSHPRVARVLTPIRFDRATVVEFLAAANDTKLQEAFLRKHPDSDTYLQDQYAKAWEALRHPDEMDQINSHRFKWLWRSMALIMQSIVDHQPGWQRLTLPYWSSYFTSSGHFHGQVMRAHASTLESLQLNGTDLDDLLSTLHGPVEREDKSRDGMDVGGDDDDEDQRDPLKPDPRGMDRHAAVSKTETEAKRKPRAYTLLPRLTDLTLGGSYFYMDDLLVAMPHLQRLCLDSADGSLLWTLQKLQLTSLTELHVTHAFVMDDAKHLVQMLESCPALTRLWLPRLGYKNPNFRVTGEEYLSWLKACSRRSHPTHWCVDRQRPMNWQGIIYLSFMTTFRESIQLTTVAILDEFRQWRGLRELALPMCLDLTQLIRDAQGQFEPLPATVQLGGPLSSSPSPLTTLGSVLSVGQLPLVSLATHDARGGLIRPVLVGRKNSEAKERRTTTTITTAEGMLTTASSTSEPWWPQLQVLSFYLNLGRLPRDLPERATMLKRLLVLPPLALLERFLLTACPRNELVQIQFVFDTREPPFFASEPKRLLFQVVQELRALAVPLMDWCCVLSKLQLRLRNGLAKHMELLMLLGGTPFTPLQLWTVHLLLRTVERLKQREELDPEMKSLEELAKQYRKKRDDKVVQQAEIIVAQHLTTQVSALELEVVGFPAPPSVKQGPSPAGRQRKS